MMDDGRNSRLLGLLVAFVAGLLLGWFALGWGIAPVSYTNGNLSELRPDHKQLYLDSVAEAFQYSRDSQAAVARLRAVGDQSTVTAELASAVQRAQDTGQQAVVDRLRSLAAATGLNLDASGQPVTTEPTAPSGQEPRAGTAGASGNLLRNICLAGLGILVLLGGISLAIWLLSRRRSAGPFDEETPEEFMRPADDSGLATPDWDAGEPKRTRVIPAVASVAKTSQVREFTATYRLGDTGYDESFDIEAPLGSGYLGECGMTLSEFISGDPNRATALEVWLFDKSDIRTVTKVLMSDYAYGNQALREKLSSRGDAVLASPGLGFVLDAQTLRLEGKILELQYAEGDAPASSTIQQMSVRLRVIEQES